MSDVVPSPITGKACLVQYINWVVCVFVFPDVLSKQAGGNQRHAGDLPLLQNPRGKDTHAGMESADLHATAAHEETQLA